MKKCVHLCWVTSGIVFCYSIGASPTTAQIIPDLTLPNNSTVTTQDNTSTITGGTVAGSNLFHSFDVFSLSTGNIAYFNNTANIQNIISRVTGYSISNIDGLIRANGGANLFLINPNGIIFGPNASLNIGGSFLASTASSLKFSNGTQFSATAPQITPLLTVSVPIGLQFGVNAGSILNQSRISGIDTRGAEDVVGLRVEPGKTLALVGGDVALRGGYLTAQQGRIELGSIAENSQVSLKPIEKGWALGYEDIQNFKDIKLSQAATVDASGEGGGEIQVQGRRVMLTDESQILSFTRGSEPGGNLTVNASDSLELSESLANSQSPSSLSTLTSGAGKAGDIKINTGKLIVQNLTTISTASRVGSTGQGGNLTVTAPDSVELVNGTLSTRTGGDGNAGNLTIDTGQLIVLNAGLVSASSLGQGNGGSIQVNATNAVSLFGVDPTSGLSSALVTRTSGGGQGGSITVNTREFRVADGAIVNAFTTGKGNAGNVTLSANTFEATNGGQVITSTRSSGNAGSINVNATDSTTFSGSDRNFTERIARFPTRVDNQGSASGLFANTAPNSTGNGGDVTLETGQLNVRDGGTVTVSSQGTGDAGNLEVQANSIRLENGGKLTATSESGKGGGNITLNNQDLLLLRDNGEISTNARGEGNGGNINIDTDILAATDKSNITAKAKRGRGGKIQIATQGFFVSPDSSINADSEQGINGVVEINRPDIDPNAELVTLPEQIVDISGLVASGCGAGGGNLARGTGEFVVTGRGGLPPSPAEATRSDTVLADLGRFVQSDKNRASGAIASNNAISSNTNAESTTLVEASSWAIGSKGEVILTANTPTFTSDLPWLKPSSCNGS